MRSLPHTCTTARHSCTRSAAMQQLSPSAHWGPLLCLADGALIYLQRQQQQAPRSSAHVQTLIVDLFQGRCRLAQAEPLAKDAAPVAGVIGLLRLGEGAVLALATEAKQVAIVAGSAVFKIKDTKLYTHAAVQKRPADLRLSSLLKHALDCSGPGSHMYLSYSLDLTSRAQQQAGRAAQYAAASTAKAAWTLTQAEFAWNGHLAKPLLDAGAAHFVVPIIAGYVIQLQSIPLLPPSVQQGQRLQQERQQQPPSAAAAGVAMQEEGQHGSSEQKQRQQQQQLGTVCVLSRRSTRRASSGVWRRGLDKQGHAAAFTETEQLLSLGPSDAKAASCVQTSGSAPLIWWQVPDLRPRPAILIHPSDEQQSEAVDKHMASLQARYGDVMAVDLLQQGGHEAALQSQFQQQAGRLAERQRSSLDASTSGQDHKTDSNASADKRKTDTGKADATAISASDAGNRTTSGASNSSNSSISGGSDRAGAVGCITFDYATVCGRLHYDWLCTLEEQLRPVIAQHGLFVAGNPAQQQQLLQQKDQQQGDTGGAKPPPSQQPNKQDTQQQADQQPHHQRRQQQQAGVLRLHSLECADRVNVVRALVGRVALEQQLMAVGLMEPGGQLHDAYPELADNLALLWCSHGEALALQHAGSESMLADLVKHGRPAMTGWLDDAAMRASRWYNDCFTAHQHQDALDVLHGKHALSSNSQSQQQQQQQQQPAQPMRSFLLILAAVLALLGAAQLATSGVRGMWNGGWEALAMALGPLAAAVAVLAFVLRLPDAYVSWPTLCEEELARPPPWKRQEAKGACSRQASRAAAASSKKLQ